MRLDEKVAIITGGGRGIGRAIARAYAAEGAIVLITSRTESELDTTSYQIRENGGRAYYLVGDVTKTEDVRHVVEETVSRFGRLDILVNNAGIVGSGNELDEISDMEWERVISTNVTGYFLFARAVVPYMIKQQSGNIINVSSGAGKKRRRNYIMSIPYSVSKFAVEGFTHVLSVRLEGTGINVNSLSPGPVRTRLLDFLSAEERRIFIRNIGKPNDPESISESAIYLACLKPGELTGETIEAKTFNSK